MREVSPTDIHTLPLRCSFCGSPESEVGLISGPGVDICDRCIRLCAETIDEDEYEEVFESSLSDLVAEVERKHGKISWTKKDTSPLRCSFCESSQLQVHKLIAGPGVYVCDRCVHRLVQTIEEEHGGL